MNEELKKAMIEEFIHRVDSKQQYEVGQTFEMFGCKYEVCPECVCEVCAFRDANCDLNVDIPACCNDVHFEVAQKKKFNVVLSTDYEIEAATEREAVNIAKQKLFRGEIGKIKVEK